MTKLHAEAIQTVREFNVLAYASEAQLERAIKLVRDGKAKRQGGMMTVQSQSDASKHYTFPIEGRCGCKCSVEQDKLCVHRLCADLLVVNGKIVEQRLSELYAG